MADAITTQWRFAQSIEKELKAALQKKDQLPLFEDIDGLIVALRNSCQTTIFHDFEFATKEGVEVRLWDAHILINSRYRKLHHHYQKVEQNKKVEKRKLDKRYADFLKTSQHFYKGYIQRLASHFSGMTGLRRIAHRLSLTSLSADERVHVSSLVERLIEMSCHSTLLHLGDLSRYRNEIRTKDRSWESSKAYYCLAGDLCPDSGSSHNQLAVIALADGNHLDVLYNLYRAIAIIDPHPAARKNLEVEFKKITTSWEKNTLQQSKKDNESTLILWFVRLHAKLFKGEDFSTYDELESEVLSRLALLLKEQSFEVTLEKFILINIAAQYLASLRFQEEPNSGTTLQAYYFFVRLNVRMYTVLLQVVLPELDNAITGDDLPNPSSQSNGARDKITAIARRILPPIRQYGTWLMSEADVLVFHAFPASTPGYITELWKVYADVMTALIASFPIHELPRLDYLLEEDLDTVGFKPLRKSNVLEVDLYVNKEGSVKARCTDPGIKRSHPNTEMKARVRDILTCSAALARKDKVPLRVDDCRFFVCIEEGLQHTSPATLQESASSQNDHSYKSSITTAEEQEDNNTEGSVASESHSMDTDMHRMVDNLLEPSSGQMNASNETSYGAFGSHTANEIFAHQDPNKTPRILPTLPSLWNTPFTPQPNELQPSSPDRPMTARQRSPLPLSTPQQQVEAAAALDQLTGYTTHSNSAWGRKASRLQEVQSASPFYNHSQQTLSPAYRPTSTSLSAFTDGSSIYANSSPLRLGSGAGTLRNGPISTFNGNNSTTVYAGASDFDKNTMLQSSLVNETNIGSYPQTPPGGQGG